MALTDGERSKYFPAIEKKHGEKIQVWMTRLKELGDVKYQDQIDFLRHNHGFSQAHANALVMYVRGSTTSRRHDSPTAYFKTLNPQSAKTMKTIFSELQKKFPELELVIAWNQPILRRGKQSVFGISASKNHLTINPFSKVVLDAHASKLQKFIVNKNTFQIPTDWSVNTVLLSSIVKARLSELQPR